MSLRIRPGLRSTATIHFGVGAFIGCLLISLGTYLTARHYLITQRENEAVRQTSLDAAFFADAALTRGADVTDVLTALSPPKGTQLVVFRDGRWYSSTVSNAPDQIPVALRNGVNNGAIIYAWARGAQGPILAVGVPLHSTGGSFFEVVEPTHLEATLNTLRAVLSAFAIAGTVLGAVFGLFASRRLVRPLGDVARAAVDIGGGNLAVRLPPTHDPDLMDLVGAFNAMVDTLNQRIERDARFAADVGHELRSPLTTLSTSVDVLQRRGGELSPQARTALDLINREVGRLEQTLEDLIELGRLDAGVGNAEPATVDAAELARQTLRHTGRPETLLRVEAPAPGAGLDIRVDKHRMSRALVNLLENADRHGAGVVAVVVRAHRTEVLVEVIDHGPGIDAFDRQRVFERFARGSGERRGSLPGSGLGLSIVAESVAADGGHVWCHPNAAHPGTTFTISLPRTNERVDSP